MSIPNKEKLHTLTKEVQIKQQDCLRFKNYGNK
jgi:hypothetical protein